MLLTKAGATTLTETFKPAVQVETQHTCGSRETARYVIPPVPLERPSAQLKEAVFLAKRDKLC